MALYEKTVSEIMTQIQRTNAEAVYGQPRQSGDTMVIPVAEIVYSWGGGGGKGKTENQDQEGEGSGVGMRAKVKPVGYINVAPDKTDYRPIIDYSRIVTIVAPMLLLLAYRLATKRRGR